MSMMIDFPLSVFPSLQVSVILRRTHERESLGGGIGRIVPWRGERLGGALPSGLEGRQLQRLPRQPDGRLFKERLRKKLRQQPANLRLAGHFGGGAEDPAQYPLLHRDGNRYPPGLSDDVELQTTRCPEH